MNLVVPLAGPDFFNNSYGVKPLLDYENSLLFERILLKRPWYPYLNQIVFVLRDIGEPTQIFVKKAQDVFPQCEYILVSALTRGALLSALAGTSLIKDFKAQLVVDLIDIDYQWKGSWPDNIFLDPEIHGIIPFFYSRSSCYSYLKTDQNGYLIQSAEKQVISDKASAGTYFFRNLSTFFSVLQGNIENFSHYSYQNNLFLCPAFNELVKQKRKVLVQEVSLIRSFSSEVKKYSFSDA